MSLVWRPNSSEQCPGLGTFSLRISCEGNTASQLERTRPVFLLYLGESRHLFETVPLTIFCLVSELTASRHFGHSRCRWSSSHPRCVQNGNWKQHGLEHLSISLLMWRKAWRITEFISSRIIGFPSILSNFLAVQEKEGQDSCRSIPVIPLSSEHLTQAQNPAAYLPYWWSPSHQERKKNHLRII